MRCNKELPRRQYEQYGERRTTPLQPLENCSKALIIPTRPHCKSIRPACLLRPALQPERAGERNHRAIIRTKFNIRIKNLKSMRLRRLRKRLHRFRNEYLNHRFNKTAGKIGFFPRGQQTACAANMGGYSRLQSAKTEIQILGMQHWTRQCDDPARARFSEL